MTFTYSLLIIGSVNALHSVQLGSLLDPLVKQLLEPVCIVGWQCNVEQDV